MTEMKKRIGALTVLLILGGACSEKKPEAAPPAPGAGAGAKAPDTTASAKPAGADQAAAQPAPAQEAPKKVVREGKGNITGEVLFTGEPPEMSEIKRGSDPGCSKMAIKDQQVLVKDGKLRNVVLRLVDAPASSPPQEPVVVDQRDCLYLPRVQAAVAGQQVLIRNSDGTLHNVHTFTGKSTLFNNAHPPKAGPLDKKFEAGIVKFKCDVHPWMTGYLVVSNNSHFAVTGEDGHFEIKDVPAGSYTLEAWHERFGTKTFKVDVGPDAPATVSVSYSASDRG